MTEYEQCQECVGYCCAAYSSTKFNDEDQKRISAFFGMPVEKFRNDYATMHFGDGYSETGRMFARPCFFWTQGRCGIHDIKPSSCAKFKPYETGCMLIHNLRADLVEKR